MRLRKKPVEVEAVLFANDNNKTLTDIQKFMNDNDLRVSYKEPEKPVIIIPTLEGDMRASVGDYIIKGINGEFYPCKPDVFKKTYEPVNGIDDATGKQEPASNIKPQSMSYDDYLNSLINNRA